METQVSTDAKFGLGITRVKGLTSLHLLLLLLLSIAWIPFNAQAEEEAAIKPEAQPKENASPLLKSDINSTETTPEPDESQSIADGSEPPLDNGAETSIETPDDVTPINVTPASTTPASTTTANTTPTINKTRNRSDAEIARDLNNRNSPLKQNELERLKGFAEGRQYDKGYEQAQSMLDTWEGSIAFDFYYGIFSLETQRYDEATFIFERLLSGQPSNLRYRLELARALYYNSNLEAAKKEFKEVLKENPPKNVTIRIERMLEDIEARLRRSESVFYMALDLDTGYDSNINNATIEDTYNGLDLSLVENGQAIDSSYNQLKSQLIYSKPFSFKNSLDINFNSNHKRNSELDNFDVDLFNLNSTFGWQINRWRLRAGGAASQTRFGGETLFNQVSGIGDATYTTGGQWSIVTGLNYGLRSSQAEISPDASLFSLAVNITTPPSPKRNSIFTVLYSNETVDEENLEHLGKTNFTFNYFVKINSTPTLANYWNFGAATFNYASVSPTEEDKRVDSLFTGSYGWDWTPWKYTVFKIGLTATYNNSNIELFTYPKVLFEAGLRLQY